MRVLFVGNSYTLYHDVPGQVQALAEADSGAPELVTERVAEGGATLADHWTRTGARERISSGNFSHVVLQDKSTQPLHDRNDFRRYARALARLAGERGARVWLFQTWARREGHEIYRWSWSGEGPAEMTRRIRAAYADLARGIGVDVAPVGDAWERARRAHPELVLHDTDLHHASPLGAHLSACVLYASLTDRAACGVDWLPPSVDRATAHALRSIAARSR